MFRRTLRRIIPTYAILPLILTGLMNLVAYQGGKLVQLFTGYSTALGASEWLTLDQERINLFADATLDHQWIHVDTERAAKESPYKSTIAHGYLTLSVLPYLWDQIIEVRNIKMLVNYGMDKMRFGQPVVCGSRVRLVASLHDIQNLRGICKTEIKFRIEIEGQRKPALEGIASFLYYFN